LQETLPAGTPPTHHGNHYPRAISEKLRLAWPTDNEYAPSSSRDRSN
jgi:hypothetical protein